MWAASKSAPRHSLVRLMACSGRAPPCAGKDFEFTSVGDATLRGFDDPVALYEVTTDRTRGDVV